MTFPTDVEAAAWAESPALLLVGAERADVRTLSYAALHERVSCVATRLALSLAAGACAANARVCVVSGADGDGVPPLTTVLAHLAAWRAGAAVVPLDAHWPARRAAAVVRATGAAAVIAPRGRGRAAAEEALVLAGLDGACVVLDADELARATDEHVADANACSHDDCDLTRERERPLPMAKELSLLPSRVDERVLAHVVFTSGTTGAPKGVLCERGHLAAYGAARRKAESLLPGDVVLAASAPTFDPFQADLVAALGCGAALALAPRSEVLADPLGVCVAVGATHVTTTPAAWVAAVAGAAATSARASHLAPPTLRVLSIGGEAMPRTMLEAWLLATSATGGRDGDDHGLELRNVYGVTECCAYQTARAMCRGDSARHIGAALPCCDIDLLRGGAYVPAKTSTSCGVGAAAPSAAIIALAALSDPAVDAHAVAIAGTGTDTGAALSPAGELCIRGQTLARGYLDDDALTAERFVAGVASEGIPGASARGRMQRRYLTGDIACLDASTKGDGSLVLLGRRDDQVKVAGARVELGEVRTVLQMRA